MSANAGSQTAAVVIEEFKALSRNSLLGFARVRMPSGVVYHDVSIHRAGDLLWASPASKPMIDRNGTAMREASGRVKYSPVVSFSDKGTRDRFSAAVIAALRAAHPEVLGE